MKGDENVSGMSQARYGWTCLCFPPVSLGDPCASLVLAGIKVLERIVTFVLQGVQFVLSLN